MIEVENILGKNVHFICTSQGAVEEWCKILREVGAIECSHLSADGAAFEKEMSGSDSPVAAIEELSFTKWAREDVSEWLKVVYKRVRDGTSLWSKYEGKLMGLKGADLMKLDEKGILEKLQIKKLSDRKLLMRLLRDLRSSRVHRRCLHTTFEKLLLTTQYSQKFDLRLIALALSDAECMMTKYLNGRIDMDLDALLRDGEVDLEEERAMERTEFSTQRFPLKTLEEWSAKDMKVPVRIVVFPRSLAKEWKSVKRRLRPYRDTVNGVVRESEVMVTLAIIIGPWYLECNEYGLCIPQQLRGIPE